MATGTLSPDPWLTVVNASGVPYVGAKIFTYLAGSTTPVATYTDVGLTVPNSNPILTDSAGRYTVFLSPGASYKYVIQDSAGAAIKTIDNISSVPGSSSSLDIIGTAGETLTAGQAVYLSDGSGSKTAGQWFKGDAANPYSSTTPQVGMVPSTITIGGSGTIRLAGSMPGLSSLTIGTSYYIGTAGAITSTAPANKRFLGVADTTSSLVLNDASVFGALAAMTNGQLLIGSTGVSPVIAALTAGAGIQITNGAGAITLANGVLDRQTPLITGGNLASNTSVETTVYTFAVPGGTLGTSKTIHLSLIGDVLQNSGASDKVYTVRVKYGATTLVTMSIQNGATGANRGSLLLDLELTGANATNVQRVKSSLLMGDSGTNNATGGAVTFTAGVAAGGVAFEVNNNVTEDSTASKNLVVTFQMSFAAVTMDMRAHTAYTEVK